jgi:S-DNA-T family DNA segregation ATPase FtsK/SpoIIIE
MGSGDLLYLSSSSPHPRRAQGAFLNDEETKKLIRFVKKQLRPSYLDEEIVFGSSTGLGIEGDFDDEYYEDAKELVVRSGKASASMIQRRFRVGYNRAARMVDMMQEEGIVGAHRGSKARKVLVDKADYLENNED